MMHPTNPQNNSIDVMSTGITPTLSAETLNALKNVATTASRVPIPPGVNGIADIVLAICAVKKYSLKLNIFSATAIPTTNRLMPKQI